MCVGTEATIPAKINKEIPLPTPNSESNSPIHIRSIEPAVITEILTTYSNIPKAGITPCFERSNNNENP